MRLSIFIIAILLITTNPLKAQKYYTKNASITFYSSSSLANIKADNNQVISVLNTITGDLQFSILMRSFHFEKALMEEHFNENYLESEKFPKATFKGNITDINRVAFTRDGVYNVNVSGDMMIHGVARKVTSNGTITVNDGKISANSKFFIRLADYNISIPAVVKNNIAESVEITVASNFDRKM